MAPVRVYKSCIHPDCTRTCFYNDEEPPYQTYLEAAGWSFNAKGDALCPPHAKYLDALNYFSQFAAF